MLFMTGAYTALNLFFFVIGVCAFAVEAFALTDALRRPAQAYTAAGKQSKQIWLLILGVATVIGLYFALYANPVAAILPVAAFVAAAVYLTDVRPKVKDFKSNRGNGGTSWGPYGPW